MDRNKLIAIVVGALSALGVVAYGLGTAEAATWHDYKGDVFAGHAYGLQVPGDARSYEVVLSGDGNASAKLAFFDPSGAPLGYHQLSKDLTSAGVVAPQPGRHFLYIYDLQGGALSLRVDAAATPGALDLAQVRLARQDVDVGSQDAPAKLDKAFTAKVSSAPVFVTLLYEGSAQDLDATVSSAKGDVVTITGETGSAFSPGVWTAQTGTRTSNPANLEGTAYTVTVHAARFEGRLVLATLALDLKAPPLPPTGGVPPPPPTPAPLPAHPGAAFALPVGKAMAFDAAKGALLLRPAHAEDSGNDSRVADAISIYSPDDSLLAFVTLDSRHPQAKVDLPEDGEYVAYVHQSEGEAVLAQLEGARAPTALRSLELAKESYSFDASSFLLGENGRGAFVLEHAPVALQLRIDEGSTALLADATVRNENGVVAVASTAVGTPGGGWFAWSDQAPERFAGGEHTLSVDGLFHGKLTLTSVHYQRAVTEPVAAEEPAQDDQDAPQAPVSRAVDAVLALFG